VRRVNALPAAFAHDDFDWRTYNRAYRLEIKEDERIHTQCLVPADYRFHDGTLTRHSDRLPLHPNHRLLYETLLQLQVRRVMEVGCGGGDHLHNLGILASEIQLFGVDRADAQLAYLRERHPHLRADVREFDITLPFSALLPSVDAAFTQAVIMHIQTGNGHVVALANMFRMATRQVVLMENWSRHPFLDAIRLLQQQRMIPWAELHSYFRRSPEFGDRPHLMVLSAAPLDYEPLEDYSVLLDSVVNV